MSATSHDARAREALTRALDQGADAATLLGALGRVIAAGADEDGALADRVRARVDAAEVSAAIGGFDFEALEDAAIALAAALDDEDAAAVVASLEARDALERLLLAAETLTGAKPELTADQEALMTAFDEAARASAWRLTLANEPRGERTAAIAKAHRERFFFWSLGAGVDPHAASQLASVATLLAQFPEARAHFEGVTRAARALASSARTASREAAGGGARVTSIADWLERSKAKRPDAELRVAAAAVEHEVTVIRTREYEISWRDPNALVIDLLADRAGDEAPSAILPDGAVIRFAPEPSAIERFVLELPPALLRAPYVMVRLPLARGVIDLRLPPSSAS